MENEFVKWHMGHSNFGSDFANIYDQNNILIAQGCLREFAVQIIREHNSRPHLKAVAQAAMEYIPQIAKLYELMMGKMFNMPSLNLKETDQEK